MTPKTQRPGSSVFWLGLHLTLALACVAGLERWLGGTGAGQSSGGGLGVADLGFLGALDFWTQTAGAVLETLAIAVLATVLGALGGGALGMLATRSAVPRDRTWLHRALVLVARLGLDCMRAIPDFAWALLLLTLFGAGPITGVLALATSNAGILGRLFSEQWETLSDPARGLASSGHDSRFVRFIYVHRWAFAATNRSFTLLRLECTVRNASVIGVVGGGGLGGQIFEAFSLGSMQKAVVLFVVLCAVAGGTERASAKLASMGTPRKRSIAATGAVMLACAWLAAPAMRTVERLQRTDFGWVWGLVRRLLQPDLAWATMAGLLRECALPLVLSYLATLAAALFALLLAFPFAKSTQTRWGWPALAAGWKGRLRRGAASLGRWCALVARTLPVEAAVLLFAFAWGLGWKAALAALTLHSAALLLRLYYDLLDQHPRHLLEHRGAMRRMDWWSYVVVPQLWPRWRSFVFVLGDANLRSGIVLGMIGVGGIGDRFHSALSFWKLETASSCLLCMLLLSLLSDRTARYVARSA